MNKFDVGMKNEFKRKPWGRNQQALRFDWLIKQISTMGRWPTIIWETVGGQPKYGDIGK